MSSACRRIPDKLHEIFTKYLYTVNLGCVLNFFANTNIQMVMDTNSKTFVSVIPDGLDSTEGSDSTAADGEVKQRRSCARKYSSDG
jgi:hypothetical protein